jgi:hypothetical protein
VVQDFLTPVDIDNLHVIGNIADSILLDRNKIESAIFPMTCKLSISTGVKKSWTTSLAQG